MVDFLFQIVKSLLPWIIVSGLVHYINVRNEKEWKKYIDEEKNNALNKKYEIAYPPVIYGLMYACLIFFSGLLIYAYIDSQLSLFVGIVLGVFVALGVYGVLGTHVWKIWVEGTHIIYRGYNGIKHYYAFSEITRIEEKFNGACVYYIGKKRIFKIDNNVAMGTVLKGQLIRNGVPCELEGMSIDKFVLKPQTVYLVISAMCVGCFAWFLEIMISQGEITSNYFMPMLIALAIAVIVLIDLFTDRFRINGNEIVRKRGFLIKKFQIHEVEYVRVKKGLFRENIEFYVNGKCVTKVWMKNRPFELLKKRLAKEKISYRN